MKNSVDVFTEGNIDVNIVETQTVPFFTTKIVFSFLENEHAISTAIPCISEKPPGTAFIPSILKGAFRWRVS